MTNPAEDFQAYRPLLFSIAYRMTGSASEAEDLVQDSYLRYRAAPKEDIRSLKSYLSTIITRLAIDHLKSAQARREQYVGPWLPEPLLTSDGDPLLQKVEQREMIASAFLVLLETLSPQERAVFLLREVFEYEYGQIAEILGIGVANCRQIFHRAQQRVAERRPRFEPSQEAQRRLIERFLAACRRGDVAALADVLAQDVVSWSDGGGKVSAARQPVRGRDRVTRLVLGLIGKAPVDLRMEIAEVNGAPALLLFTGETLLSVSAFQVAGGRVHALQAVLNPDKLAYIRRQVNPQT
ncbi:MAG TPA: RNA polymerase sigma-70 factor [Roseiflexaceae bacterium]